MPFLVILFSPTNFKSNTAPPLTAPRHIPIDEIMHYMMVPISLDFGMAWLLRYGNPHGKLVGDKKCIYFEEQDEFSPLNCALMVTLLMILHHACQPLIKNHLKG